MALAETPDTDLPEGYAPCEDEEYMCPRHLEFFRRQLLTWKQDIVDESRETIANLQKESATHPDVTDRAASEANRTLELRGRDRQRKLIAKIDAALRRIEDGSYGFCEATGDPIRLARLQARPIATLTIEAQERHEQKERIGN